MLPSPQVRRELSPVFELGFHGDRYLLSLVDGIMRSADAFVETGTNVGSTARYVARKCPQVAVYSCEPDPDAFRVAQQTLAGLDNATLYNLGSPEFLDVVHADHPGLLRSTNLYFLDAHGYGFAWPLRDEVEFITQRLDRGVFIIDDFEVPGKPEFRCEASEGDKCCFAYVQGSLAKGRTYRVVYPAYTEHTSPHHPLVGYVVVEFGTDAVARIADGNDNFAVTMFTP